ncbi:MAG TPA: hypothetical protein VEL31_06315 [Ktedonobacteraceae bacterium]|nr:hypothetical protein [Ktedonobacteraceae bacterium]
MSPDPVKRQKAQMIIHGCATAAAGWSALTATLPIVGPVTGDTVGLGAVTIIMGTLLSREVFHQEWTEASWKGTAAAVVQFFLGATAIKIVLSFIPIVSNIASAIVSFGTVEAVGWGLYHILEEGKRPDALSVEEIKEYIRASIIEQEKRKEEFAWLEQLPPDVKKRYDELSKQLLASNLSSEQRAAIAKQIEQLVDPYQPSTSYRKFVPGLVPFPRLRASSQGGTQMR